MREQVVTSYILDEIETLSRPQLESVQLQYGYGLFTGGLGFHHLMQLEKRLRFEVQSALGITCNVKLVGPREIERSEGKAVRVVDKRTL